MTGGEIATLLHAACEDAGLDGAVITHVMLCFSIRWGQQLKADLDLALYADEMKETGDGGDTGV